VSVTPTLRLERKCWKAGERVVVGIDEVGRGAWAGPVTVAAVVPPPEHLRGVRDSKQLPPDQRTRVAANVRDWAVGIGIGHASHDECDALGMTAALKVAGIER
jgi:ribonuclease HII